MSRGIVQKVLMEHVVGDAIKLPTNDRVRCFICQNFYWKIYSDHVECSFCKSVYVIVDSKVHAFGDQAWWSGAKKGRSGSLVDDARLSSDWVIFPDSLKHIRSGTVYSLTHPMSKMFFTSKRGLLGAARK